MCWSTAMLKKSGDKSKFLKNLLVNLRLDLRHLQIAGNSLEPLLPLLFRNKIEELG